jgi:adenosylhomocysteine nucleosidase
MIENPRAIIIVSADAEWQAIKEIVPGIRLRSSPYGEWFERKEERVELIFFHGGWGKIAAAGSAQYAIDQWHPDLLINLGTCGGLAGKIEKNTTILVDRTIVYDIYEAMGDLKSHIERYSTDLDLSWLKEPYPIPVVRNLLVSGDRDLRPQDISDLVEEYGAVAGDWESGAIAYVAARNKSRCLILRSVSDLVDKDGGDFYGDIDLFAGSARQIMNRLFNSLPGWLHCAGLIPST